MTTRHERAREYIEERTDRETNPPHWIWTAYCKNENSRPNPVAYVNALPREFPVKRWVFETHVGPLTGKRVRNIAACDEPRCINPDHLEIQPWNSRTHVSRRPARFAEDL
jgi:hypothetical protein